MLPLQRKCIKVCHEKYKPSNKPSKRPTRPGKEAYDENDPRRPRPSGGPRPPRPSGVSPRPPGPKNDPRRPRPSRGPRPPRPSGGSRRPPPRPSLVSLFCLRTI